MRKSVYGFTLIELLVAIAIMAITGMYILSNYSSFGEDQNLKNAALDIQSLLRQAQSSATANVKCDTQFGATWQVEFADATTVNLKCQEPLASSILKKTLTLGTNIQISIHTGEITQRRGAGISAVMTPCPEDLSDPVTISFAPLDGKIDLGGAQDGAICTSLTFQLTNSKTGSTKDLVIEKGGRIYAQ